MYINRDFKQLFTVLIVATFFANCNGRESKVNEKNKSEDSIRLHEADDQNVDAENFQIENVFEKRIKLNGDEELLKFVRNFSKRELPYELIIGSGDWIDFSSSNYKEIPRSIAIKYLCDNEKGKALQPGGGFHQYYFGTRVDFSNTLTGLIYYRTSSDYTGYIMGLVNENGELQNEIFLAGTKGEYDIEAQKEAKILENRSIEVKEITRSDLKRTEEPFEAKITKTFFRILPDGRIDHEKDSVIANTLVYQDKDHRYRLYEK